MTIRTESQGSNFITKTFTCEEPKPKSPFVDDWVLIESPSAAEEFEGPKKAFTEKAEQLHAHVDPFHQFYLDLLPIINYERSDYKILYMNKGKLDLYMPKLPFGSYPLGDKVVQCVTTIIKKIQSFHENQKQQNRWKVLKIARRTLPCLQKIIDNYSYSKFENSLEKPYNRIVAWRSYIKFKNGLQEQYNQLENWIASSSISSSYIVDEYIRCHYGYNIFDLIDIHGDTYLKTEIISTLKKYYGERLTNFAIDRFLSEEKTTPQLTFTEEEGLRFLEDGDRISFNQVYGLIFTIATNVKREDLKWKYENVDKGTTPFEELSAEKIDKLLIYFRCAPDGHNLLDYFGIRVSLDKHTVDSAYLEMFPAEDMEEQSRLNEMNVYADIESSKIWHQGQVILMTDIQMFDQLNMIFSQPYNSQLFHSDKYISFLNVAATCIAYLQSFKANKEAIDANLPVLIKKLEDIANHAHKMYPDGFVADYKYYLLTLIGKLKEARRDPNIDLREYYLSLFVHPLQSKENKLKTPSLRKQLQPFEFFARKVAYWNWNYQTNAFFVDDKGKLKNPKQMQHRVGTLFYVSTGTSMELYEVKELIIKDGFCCQLCTPYDTDEYVEAKNPIPIKITFQGTIDSPLSKARNFYVQGAGYELWLDKKTTLVIPKLRDLMADLRSPYEHGVKPTFCLDYVGHSLGGSDAQNAAAYLSEIFLTKKKWFGWISQINVHTFNTAGVPKDTIKRFNKNYENHQNIIGKVTHSIVKNDLVSRPQHLLGAGFDDLMKIVVLEVSNLGVSNIFINHCDYIHSWTDNILPHKIMCHEQDKRALKKYLYSMTNSWTDLKGHINELVEESPIAKIALAVIIILNEGALFMSTATFATEIINSYNKGQITGSVSEIWDAISSKWHGTQILEGTG